MGTQVYMYLIFLCDFHQGSFHVAALFENVPKMLRMPDEDGEEPLYACLSSRDHACDVKWRHDVTEIRSDAGAPPLEPQMVRASDLSLQLRGLLAKIEGVGKTEMKTASAEDEPKPKSEVCCSNRLKCILYMYMYVCTLYGKCICKRTRTSLAFCLVRRRPVQPRTLTKPQTMTCRS